MTMRSGWLIDKSEAVSRGAMVTAMHPLAADVGAQILERGGSAIDAAIATAFAIGVVEPFMSGVGGIAFLTSLLCLSVQGVFIVMGIASAVAAIACRWLVEPARGHAAAPAVATVTTEPQAAGRELTTVGSP